MPKKKLTPEQIAQEILKKVPRPLLNLFYSDELPEKIIKICLDSGIEEEEKIGKISYFMGEILMGGLPPEELLDALKKEGGFSPIRATKIFREIDGQIFSLVRGSLNILYKKEREIEEAPEKEKEVLEKITKKELEEKPPKKEDIYREPIE